MYEKLNRDELVAALRASEAQAQQLQAMARQYQVVQETLNAGVVVHGADGSVRSANRMALEALGLKEIGINGRWQTDWELRDEHGQRLAPEDFPYRQVLASRRPLRDKVVQVYRHDLQTTRWHVANASPVLDADGELQEVVVTFVDISATHLALQALKVSEHRFRSVLDQACGIAIQGCDKHGRVIYWNRGSEQLFGHHHEDACGQRLAELLLPHEQRAAFVEGFQQMLEHGEVPAPTEQVLLRKDGSAAQTYASQVLISLPDGSREWYCIEFDISERKELESDLARYYSRFRAISEASSLGVFSTDVTGRINYANVNFQHLMNRASSELLGHCWLDLVAAEDVRYVETSWQQALQQGSNLTLELRVRVNDDYHWLRLNGAPVSERGMLAGFVLTVEDVSQRKAMEAAIRESEEKFSKVYQTLPDGLMITSIATAEILDVNRQWELVTGYSPAESIGRTTFELDIWAHPDDRWDLVGDIRTGKEVREREIQIRRKDGQWVWCEFSAVPIEMGGELLLISVLRDITDRWTIATALRDSEEKFSKAFHLMPDLVVFTDYHSGRYLDMNDQLPALLGYTREEALDHTSDDLHIWADEAQREAVIDELQQHNEVRLLEVELRRKDGRRIWCEYSAIPCELGGQRMLMSIVRDITDRKTIAAALKDSEEKFATIYQLLPDALGITDLADGRLIDVNQAWERITGYSPDECRGRTTKEIGLYTHDEDRRKIVECLRSGESLHQREIRIRRKDGSNSWGEISGVISEVNKRQVLIWVLRDINDRWTISMELRQSEEKLSKAFHLLPDTLMFSDMETGSILELNERWEEVTGLPRQRAIGHSLQELGMIIHPEEWQTVMERLSQGLETRNQILRLRTEKRPMVEVDYSGVPVEVQGKRVAMAILRDVTEKQQIERELRDLNVNLEVRVQTRTAELESTNRELQHTLQTLQLAQNELVRAERLASLGSLVAGVAHELNTPIGNSVTVASTLQEKTREFEQDFAGGTLKKSGLTSYLDTASTASDLLMRNLHQARELIASFKQVAVDQTSEKRRGFDLKEVIEEVVATLHPMLKKTPHEVKLTLQPEIAMDSFPGPLGQVITNLVNNALLHAFGDTGTGQIHIEAYAADSELVEIQIQDNGCGIPQHHLPKIFDPFFTTRLGQGGSGLGLHIVYSIVTRVLGGRINVRSRPSAGTLFTIQVPRVAPAQMENSA